MLSTMIVLCCAYIWLHPLRSLSLGQGQGTDPQTSLSLDLGAWRRPPLRRLISSSAGLASLGTVALAASLIAGTLAARTYERPLSFGLIALALVAIPGATIGEAAEIAGATWL